MSKSEKLSGKENDLRPDTKLGKFLEIESCILADLLMYTILGGFVLFLGSFVLYASGEAVLIKRALFCFITCEIILAIILHIMYFTSKEK